MPSEIRPAKPDASFRESEYCIAVLAFFLFMGTIASSFAAMGAGMVLRRDKLALCGLAILGLLIMVIVVAALRRI